VCGSLSLSSEATVDVPPRIIDMMYKSSPGGSSPQNELAGSGSEGEINSQFEIVSVVDEYTDDDGGDFRNTDSDHRAIRHRRDKDEESIYYEDLLQEKDTRIEELEAANRMKDDLLQILEQRLNETRVKNKEGIYWLQLELDAARRDHDATEESMAELMNDLQSMTAIPNPNEVTEEILRDAINTNYQQVIASLENQITMIKTSAGEVVKTLKEEIAELMEDRASIEVTLMNQLAALDNEKSVREAQLKQELRSKDDTIQQMMSIHGEASKPMELPEREQYEIVISQLTDTMKMMEERTRGECEQSYEAVLRLELENAELKADLDRAEENIGTLRAEMIPEPEVYDLKRISRELQDATESIESVREMWTKMDASINVLTASITTLQSSGSGGGGSKNRTILKTSLHTASLLHEQAKLSLSLIELKLQNAFQDIQNERRTSETNGVVPSDDEAVLDQMKEIQSEVMKVLMQVDTKISKRIRDVERRALRETTTTTTTDVHMRSEPIKSTDGEDMILEEELVESIIDTSLESTKNSDSRGEQGTTSSMTISKEMLDKLEMETLRVIERIKEKNRLIQTMHKRLRAALASEEQLKSQLKLARRSTRPIDPPTKSMLVAEANLVGIGPSPRRVTPRSNTTSLHTPGMNGTSHGTATAGRFAYNGTLLSPMSTDPSRSAADIVVSPKYATGPISPIRPSPREISKGRIQAALSPSSSRR